MTTSHSNQNSGYYIFASLINNHLFLKHKKHASWNQITPTRRVYHFLQRHTEGTICLNKGKIETLLIYISWISFWLSYYKQEFRSVLQQYLQ